MTVTELGVKVPVSVLGAEFDQVTPPELVTQFEDVLATKPEVLCSLLIVFFSIFFKSFAI